MFIVLANINICRTGREPRGSRQAINGRKVSRWQLPGSPQETPGRPQGPTRYFAKYIIVPSVICEAFACPGGGPRGGRGGGRMPPGGPQEAPRRPRGVSRTAGRSVAISAQARACRLWRHRFDTLLRHLVYLLCLALQRYWSPAFALGPPSSRHKQLLGSIWRTCSAARQGPW